MKLTLTSVSVAIALFIAQGPLAAHHGQAAYSNDKQVTITGTVSEWQFMNPHCIVSVDVKDEAGKTEKWQGELTSPNHLVRAGWNSNSLKFGDKVQLTGWRAKSGANSLWITKTVVNGQELKTAEGT